MKKLLFLFTLLITLLISPIFLSSAVEINKDEYYRKLESNTSTIFQNITHEQIIAETRTDMPSGWDQGTGGTQYIDTNKWYGQRINVLNIPSDSDACVIPWSIQNGFGWSMVDVTEMAKDFEEKHPEYVVLGGINGDFYDWHNTKDFGQSGNGLEVVDGNMLRYKAGGWNGVGFYNTNTTEEIVFIDGSKVTRTALPVLTIYNEYGAEIASISLDKFNEDISDGETGAYFGRVIGDITTNKYGERTYSNRKFQAPTVGSGNVYIVEKAERVIYQADDNSYYGYGAISSVDASTTVPQTGFAVASKNPEVQELLTVGTYIRVQYELTGEYADVSSIIGGFALLAEDGKLPEYHSDSYLKTRAPRTIVGQKADGTVCLLTMDGRQKNRKMFGTNQQEINAFMRDYGITDAVLLDGGGSSTFFIREGNEFVVKNSPSDSGDPNSPRNVGNCLLVVMKRADFTLKETKITNNSITFNIDTTGVDFSTTTKIKCTLNGVTKEVVDGQVTFDNLTSNTAYEYMFSYDRKDKTDIETMVAGVIESAKKTPNFGELKIDVGTNKLIFTPEITDEDEALEYYRIFINNKRNPYLDEPIEVKYDLTNATIIEFDILICYNLNDGNGKVELTYHKKYDLTTNSFISDEIEDPTDDKDEEKSGCKKELSALVLSAITLASTLVLLKKREK
ncbi:MAG: phosphodiester glycosidase family protein [Bacilli bacterium]|nr:phosphodiester glycosidase family protein [Bacilli bacterium]